MGQLRCVATVLGGALLAAVLLVGCTSYVSDEAQQRFDHRVLPFTVTVYPVRVVRGEAIEHDAALAAELAAFLAKEGLAQPVVGATPAGFPAEWSHNEAKMAQRSAQAFAGQVTATTITTDYALLVELLCNSDETTVIGVHYYLVERSGLIADGSLTNSHWEEFQKVQPHDRHGGLAVAELMLRRLWLRPAAAGG